MKTIRIQVFGALVSLAVLAGCVSAPVSHGNDRKVPEKLTVREDGTLWFRDRPMPKRDVIIYGDGMGGEKAAVRIRVSPLRPDFFRDTIVVERE